MLLDEIVEQKKKEIIADRQSVSISQLEKMILGVSPPRNFINPFLNSSTITIIAEVKKASPVKGLLCHNFDPAKLALDYQDGGAGAISVLTDKKYFQGNKGFIEIVRENVDLPVMRKDFIIDRYQVIESRAIGADALLLIASLLDEKELKELLTLTRSLGMEALVEVHDQPELEKALSVGATVVGINNRNLRNFSVSISTSLNLAQYVPVDVVMVSESGIGTKEDIESLIDAGFRGVLIGESLVKSSNPAAKIRELRGKSGSEDSVAGCG